MSEANVDASAKIKYCPVCGFKSEKPFTEGGFDDGGDWTCENCHEYVEAYVIMEEDENEDDGEKGYTPTLLWILSGVVLFTLLVYFL